MSPEKRYQVFLSSTFADLKEERIRVIQTLMEMDCIPAGMELFPATDEDQFEFIKRIIDDCDYYIVVVGGRYGSLTGEGVSYTEKEYRYAIERKIHVIALLHGTPGDIPNSKSELDPKARERLEDFREHLSLGRLVKFWSKASDLPGLVALSLNKAIKMHPAVGWIRADSASDPALLQEINELRKDNIRLQERVAKLADQPIVDPGSLASMDETISVTGKSRGFSRGRSGREQRSYMWCATVTWSKIFALISPYLIEYIVEELVKERLGENLFSLVENGAGSCPVLDDQNFQTIKIQFLALGLIRVESLQATNGTRAQFWGLTNMGITRLYQSRVIRPSVRAND